MRHLLLALTTFASTFTFAQENPAVQQQTECGGRFEMLAQQQGREIEISYEDYKKVGGGPMTYPIAILAGFMAKGIVSVSEATAKQYYRMMRQIYSSDLQTKMRGIGLLHNRFSQRENDLNFPWIEFTQMMMDLSMTEVFCVERRGVGFTAEARKKLEEIGYKNEFELHMIGLAQRDPKAIKFAHDRTNYEMMSIPTVRSEEETMDFIREQMALYLKSK